MEDRGPGRRAVAIACSGVAAERVPGARVEPVAQVIAEAIDREDGTKIAKPAKPGKAVSHHAVLR